MDKEIFIDIQAKTEEANKKLENLVVKLKEAEANVKFATKAISENFKAQEELGKSYKNGEISIAEFNKQSKKLVDQEKELTKSWLQETTTLEQVKGEYKGLKTEIKDLEKSQGDSLNNMRAQLKLYQQSFDNLTEAQRKSKEGQDLYIQIQKQDEAVRSLEESTGRYQRNVGNYKSALAGLKDSFINATVATGSLKTGMAAVGVGIKGITKALMSNPWTAILTACAAILVKIVGMIKKAIEGNDDAGTAFQRLWAVLKTPLTFIEKSIDFIVDAFTPIINGLTEVYKAIFKLNPLFKDQVDLQDEIVVKQDELEDKEREHALNTAKREKEISRLREEASDKENKSISERSKAIVKALDLEKQTLKEELQISRERIEQFDREHRLKKKLNDDEKNQRTQLLVDIENKEKEYYTHVKKYNKELQTIDNEAAKYWEDVNVPLEKAVDNIKEYFREQLNTSLKSINEDINKNLADIRKNTNYWGAGSINYVEEAINNKQYESALSFLNSNIAVTDRTRNFIESLKQNLKEAVEITSEINRREIETVENTTKLKKKEAKESYEKNRENQENLAEKQRELNEKLEDENFKYKQELEEDEFTRRLKQLKKEHKEREDYYKEEYKKQQGLIKQYGADSVIGKIATENSKKLIENYNLFQRNFERSLGEIFEKYGLIPGRIKADNPYYKEILGKVQDQLSKEAEPIIPDSEINKRNKKLYGEGMGIEFSKESLENYKVYLKQNIDIIEYLLNEIDMLEFSGGLSIQQVEELDAIGENLKQQLDTYKGFLNDVNSAEEEQLDISLKKWETWSKSISDVLSSFGDLLTEIANLNQSDLERVYSNWDKLKEAGEEVDVAEKEAALKKVDRIEAESKATILLNQAAAVSDAIATSINIAKNTPGGLVAKIAAFASATAAFTAKVISSINQWKTVTEQAKQEREKIAQYREGGFISGSGTTRSDSIPARLSNGEFVVNASATSKNRQLLERLNNGGVINSDNMLLIRAIQNIKPVVSVQEITKVQKRVSLKESMLK